MKQILLTTIFFLALFTINAQNKKVEINSSIAKNTKLDIHPIQSAIQVQKLSSEAINDVSKPRWNKSLINLEIKHKVSAEIQAIIDEKTNLKRNNLKSSYIDEQQSTNSLGAPVLGTNFKGNSHNGSIPPDNSMAISNGGIIVSVVNTNIDYYDASGSLLYSSPFTDFFNDSTLIGNNIFDPRVLYDSEADRFIFVVLFVNKKLSLSKVITCFSKTNNPIDGWWVYNVTGNPLNDGSWFDFPQIGISKNDLFVTGNLWDYSAINGADTCNQSVIYQIEKGNAYNGDSLQWFLWSNISELPVFIKPVSSAVSENYGKGIYLLSSNVRSPFGLNPHLLCITDDLSGLPELNVYSPNIVEAKTNYLFVNGDALQEGTDVALDNHSFYHTDAVYLNGIIHLVLCGGDINGYAGINYCRLNVSTLELKLSGYGLNGFDYAYPSIAINDTTSGNETVLISFLRSGSTIYPEARVIACDNQNNWSNSTVVKAGEIYVDGYKTTNVTRWGDYTQICRKMNSNPPEFWMSSQYGAVVGDYNLLETWIAQIKNITTDVSEIKNSEKEKIKVFPNPVYDMFNVEFNIEERTTISINLTDINGRIVKVLYNDIAKKGRNLFSFNKGVLSSGIYMLNVKDNSNLLKAAKIIVE